MYTAKIPKLAVIALAGFAVSESYSVPWASIDVPIELQKRVFPFVEGALMCLQESGSPNEGTYNFLRLLVELRPFFWRTMAAISLQFPNSRLLQCIKIIKDADAKAFFNKWPSALKA
ncbi:hypothetical protein ARMGADRAFT_1087518 [Armillaria gallica]|uniref:Secreted protein n=1 Tax=Armillaria gallica TaxID=47427 RepID=A0A2H3D8E3_ARMGA|nr:hypothetical protein ARMGADRAFT_1087518 [Armillaria gallica]